MAEKSSPSLIRSPLTWLTLVAVIAVSGTFYWQSEREKARQRFELERVAAEQAELARTKEAEVRRENERKKMLAEIRAQKDAEEEQRQKAIVIRQAEVENKQFVADERYIPPQQAAYQSYLMQQDQRQRNYEDRRQRYVDQSAMYRARQDVERQKRYLQEREYEEQAARYRRDANARYGR